MHGGRFQWRSLLGIHMVVEASHTPDSFLVRPLEEERQQEGDAGVREEQGVSDVEEETSEEGQTPITFRDPGVPS